MRRQRWRIPLWLLSWTGLCATAWAQPVSLSVSQSAVDPLGVTFYLNARGPDGLPVRAAGAQVSATANGATLTAETGQTFIQSGDGVAYILLVDVSKSIGAAQFEQVRRAMEAFAAGLRRVDRLAVLTFGDSVQVALDFTTGQQRITAALTSLQLGSSQTKLYLAVNRALELGARKDADLPQRRAIVALTDGKDEGSGLTLEDVLAGINSAGLPVYTIGSSRLPEPARKKYFDGLRRLSANSGGDFFEASPAFAHDFEIIRQSVTGVLPARFSCGPCPRTGKPETWTLTLKTGEKALTAKAQVTLQPLAAKAAPTAAPLRTNRFWFLTPLPLLVLLVAAIRRRKQKRKAALLAMQEDTDPVSPPATEFPPLPVSAPREPVLDDSVNLKLVCVHGMSPGETHRMRLKEKASVGRDASCGLALPRESSLAPKQFELSLSSGRIVIRDLSEAGTTVVNGVPIKGVHRLEDGDLIGAGGAEFRLLMPKQ